MPRSTPLLRWASGPTRRSSKGGWTEEEDNLLAAVVRKFNGKNWKKIAEQFPGRTDVQCLHRWQKVLNPELVKGPWSKEEDDRIIELVQKHGCRKWSVIAKSLPRRNGKQCRERWHNHLDPAIKKDAWTEEEESLLTHYHQVYGNKWAKIARFLPGRTDNAIKNHWNCSLKKRLDFQAFQTTPEIKTSETKVHLSTVKTEEFVYTDSWFGSDTGSETCSTELALGNTPGPTPQSQTRVGVRQQTETLGASKYYLNQVSTTLFDERNDSFSGVDTSLNMSTQRNHEAATLTPKTPMESCKRTNGCGLSIDLGFSNLDKSFLSLSTPGLSEDSSLGKKKDKANGVSTCFQDTCYGILWYKPPKFKISETGLLNEVDSIENADSLPSPLYFSTPSSYARSAPASPESTLRNSARSFNTPSIIRKRKSGDLINYDRKLKSREVAYKPVERCLKPSFDMEADLDEVKYGSSVASSNEVLGLTSTS